MLKKLIELIKSIKINAALLYDQHWIRIDLLFISFNFYRFYAFIRLNIVTKIVNN